MRAMAVGEQVTPTEFRFLLLPACYREDTPTECEQSPTEVGGVPRVLTRSREQAAANEGRREGIC